MTPGAAVKKSLDPSRKSTAASDFETSLRRKIVGQEAAIEVVCEAYQMFLAGLQPEGRPLGNFLFLGPTGSGKSRCVEAMAEVLFGNPLAVLKIDCAEFQHSHEIAKLIGSPPGYLGHRETHPLLTQEALNQHHTDSAKVTLLLFDEIEKASDALWQLLLGILDKATLTLGDNRRVDFSKCLIFMTSNLGAKETSKLIEGGLGFGTSARVSSDKLESAAIAAAQSNFSPEFMNRIDKTVVFERLGREQLETILDIELGRVQQRILQSSGNKQFVFACTDDCKEFLIETGTDEKYGARPLKRAIEKHLVLPLASLLATAQIKLGDFIRVGWGEAGMTFDCEAEGALVPVLLEKYGQQPVAKKAPKPPSPPKKPTLNEYLDAVICQERPIDDWDTR